MLSETLPIYGLADSAGRRMCLMLTIGTFAGDDRQAAERALPVVLEALNAAREVHDEDCLYAYYAKPAPAENFVRNVRHAISRTLAAGRGVLWLRTDSEHDLRAALAIARSDYTTTAIVHGCETNQGSL